MAKISNGLNYADSETLRKLIFNVKGPPKGSNEGSKHYRRPLQLILPFFGLYSLWRIILWFFEKSGVTPARAISDVPYRSYTPEIRKDSLDCRKMLTSSLALFRLGKRAERLKKEMFLTFY